MAGPCLGSLGFCVLVCHFEKNHKFVLLCFKQRNVRICGSWRGLHPQRRAFPAFSGASSRGTEAAENWCGSSGVTATFSQKTDFRSVCPFLSGAQTWRDKVADWVGALSVPRMDGSHIVTQLELFCSSRIKCLCGQINAQ